MKTSKYYFITVCAVLFIMSIACSYAQNILPDGEFTTIPSTCSIAGTTFWDNWIFTNSTTGTLSQSTAHGGTGYAAKLTTIDGNGTGFVSRPIAVTPGATYNFSYYVRSDQGSTSQTWFHMASFQDYAWAHWDGNTVNDLVVPTTSWTLHQYTYTAPSTTNYAQIQFGTAFTTPGSIEISQVYMAPVPEPGSMAVMLSGIVGLVGFAVRRRK